MSTATLSNTFVFVNTYVRMSRYDAVMSRRGDNRRGAVLERAVRLASIEGLEALSFGRLASELDPESMRKVKESGQAVGAQVLTDLSGFAPPTIAARQWAATASAEVLGSSLLHACLPH